MKKNILKFIITFTFVFAILGSFLAVGFNYAKADETSITYVALGDSIADGTALAGYEKYTFVQGSYTETYKELLQEFYTTVNATTYAMASSNTSELLALLNGEDTTRYQDLDATEVLSNIADADVITVCIGANDILLPAIANIDGYITGDNDRVYMESVLANGLTNFNANFPQIINRITELNPDATVIFNDVYNPYKCFELTGEIAEIAPFLGINVENVNSIGAVTEIYLAGGVDSLGDEIVGLNSLMARYIDECGNTNIKLTNVKTLFDEVAQETPENYPILVNADSSKISPTNYNNFTEFADPHPTFAGHEMIASAIALIEIGNDEPVIPNDPEEPENPEEPEVEEYVTVSYVTYGGFLCDELGNVINGQQVQAGKTFTCLTPTKAQSPFGGWYLDSSFTTKWNFENVITEDITLYAKWISLTCNNSQYKTQDIANPHNVEFSLNIEDSNNYDITWYVNDKIVAGQNGSMFTFEPTKSGTFAVKAIVNGVATKFVDIVINRSQLSNVQIVLKEKDVNNNFVIEIIDNSYSDDELVWYRSYNEYDGEPEKICVGKSILNYKFNSNCKIWLEYADSEQIISNVLEIKVDNPAPTDVIIGVISIVAIIGVLIALIVITKKKYDDFG